MSRRPSVLHIGKYEVEISNLDKVLFPSTGFTKGDVINYYLNVAPVLLPHLKDRALTMKRYPDGVERFFFYEKHCPSHRPPWLRTVRVASKARRGEISFCVVDRLPALIWAANLADLELHVSLARIRSLRRPTTLVFDLDPGEGSTLLDCGRVAMEIRGRLSGAGLQCFPKTSGSKGLQIYVPLNTPTTFDRTKEIARAMAESLATDFPDAIVANMRKNLRRRKVLIDWSQNDDHKTTICAYSLRGTPRPSVSTPVEWQEIETALRRKDADRLRFTPEQVLQRVQRRGDLFAPVLTLKQRL